jgi:uncharacterized protein YfbU (UPF0304 family)
MNQCLSENLEKYRDIGSSVSSQVSSILKDHERVFKDNQQAITQCLSENLEEYRDIGSSVSNQFSNILKEQEKVFKDNQQVMNQSLTETIDKFKDVSSSVSHQLQYFKRVNIVILVLSILSFINCGILFINFLFKR